MINNFKKIFGKPKEIIIVIGDWNDQNIYVEKRRKKM